MVGFAKVDFFSFGESPYLVYIYIQNLFYNIQSKRISMSNSSNFRKYEFYLEKFRKSHQIEDFLNYFSAHVWYRLRLRATYPAAASKADETEFTNFLVSKLCEITYEDKIPLPIRILHSLNENTNGNDIELVLAVAKDKYLKFPCQAKRLNLNNKRKVSHAIYSEIWYIPKNGKIYQINALRSYAKKKLGYPLYMLYNFSDEDKANQNYPDSELFGCTLVSAQYIAEQHFHENLHFTDIHPPGKPISSITTIDESDLDVIDSLWGETKKQPCMKIYTYNEIFNEPGFTEFNPPTYVDKRFIFSDKSLSEILSNNQITSTETYNPKFRIVITKEPILHRKRLNDHLLK